MKALQGVLTALVLEGGGEGGEGEGPGVGLGQGQGNELTYIYAQ